MIGDACRPSTRSRARPEDRHDVAITLLGRAVARGRSPRSWRFSENGRQSLSRFTADGRLADEGEGLCRHREHRERPVSCLLGLRARPDRSRRNRGTPAGGRKIRRQHIAACDDGAHRLAECSKAWMPPPLGPWVADTQGTFRLREGNTDGQPFCRNHRPGSARV